jgi:Leucine-rich repeat (LRR) protein
MARAAWAAWLLVLLFCGAWTPRRILVSAATDANDVTALNTLFTSMNSPGQLQGWKASGGDPCSESWQGITCSGSSVTAIKLPGLGLSGTLAYNMNTMDSLVELDMSQNSLGGGQQIPYNLPNKKLERLNLAGNQFSGGVPYSISTMPKLQYLNLNHNQLSGDITDIFSNLPSLTTV